MNLNQTKLMGLTMELDLKTREFKQLCEQLEKIKEKNIDPNDQRLLIIKDLFQKNHNDIVKINTQLKKLKQEEQLEEQQKLEKYKPENIFNKKDSMQKEQQENVNIAVIPTKKNLFMKIIEKIKNFFHKKI